MRGAAAVVLGACCCCGAAAGRDDDSDEGPPPTPRPVRLLPELREPPAVPEQSAFPCNEGRKRAHSVSWAGALLNASRHLVWSPVRLRNGCRIVRSDWRQRQRTAMARPLRLQMRAVNGSGALRRLPIERVGPSAAGRPRTVLRPYVDDDAWAAERWLLVDVGADFFLRRARPYFGSTFQVMCGYPGAERFEERWWAFGSGERDAFPPFVRWRGAASSAGAALGGEPGDPSATDAPSGATPRAVPADFPRWLGDHALPEDFVVLRLAAASPAELAAAEALLSSGAAALLDEVFFECRPFREACRSLSRRFREHGIYWHEWQ